MLTCLSVSTSARQNQSLLLFCYIAGRNCKQSTRAASHSCRQYSFKGCHLLSSAIPAMPELAQLASAPACSGGLEAHMWAGDSGVLAHIEKVLEKEGLRYKVNWVSHGAAEAGAPTCSSDTGSFAAHPASGAGLQRYHESCCEHWKKTAACFLRYKICKKTIFSSLCLGQCMWRFICCTGRNYLSYNKHW